MATANLPLHMYDRLAEYLTRFFDAEPVSDGSRAVSFGGSVDRSSYRLTRCDTVSLFDGSPALADELSRVAKVIECEERENNVRKCPVDRTAKETLLRFGGGAARDAYADGLDKGLAHAPYGCANPEPTRVVRVSAGGWHWAFVQVGTWAEGGNVKWPPLPELEGFE